MEPQETEPQYKCRIITAERNLSAQTFLWPVKKSFACNQGGFWRQYATLPPPSLDRVMILDQWAGTTKILQMSWSLPALCLHKHHEAQGLNDLTTFVYNTNVKGLVIKKWCDGTATRHSNNRDGLQLFPSLLLSTGLQLQYTKPNWWGPCSIHHLFILVY